jgi:excisionase family DNA binding protein
MERWPALLSREEAAAYLGIGVTLLNSLRAREEIKSVQIGSAIRYRRTDLDAFVAELKESKGKFKGQRA